MLWEMLKEAALKYDAGEITLDQFRNWIDRIKNANDLDMENFALTISNMRS